MIFAYGPELRANTRKVAVVDGSRWIGRRERSSEAVGEVGINVAMAVNPSGNYGENHGSVSADGVDFRGIVVVNQNVKVSTLRNDIFAFAWLNSIA